LSSEKLNTKPHQQLKKAKPYNLAIDGNGKKFDEKQKMLMKKCEKSIKQYKNHVI
jgi:hypothetical protein